MMQTHGLLSDTVDCDKLVMFSVGTEFGSKGFSGVLPSLVPCEECPSLIPDYAPVSRKKLLEEHLGAVYQLVAVGQNLRRSLSTN